MGVSSPTSPLPGSAMSGFTSPTYTLTDDVAPSPNGVQHAVTAIGGTQADVTSHSVSNPFTLTFFRPKTLKVLGAPNSNGIYVNVPRNAYRAITRKGVVPAADQPAQVMLIRSDIQVPAGAETYDAADVKAAICAHIGYLTDLASGIGDTVQDGVL